MFMTLFRAVLLAEEVPAGAYDALSYYYVCQKLFPS